jgi:polysaccharide export outer membrane protein
MECNMTNRFTTIHSSRLLIAILCMCVASLVWAQSPMGSAKVPSAVLSENRTALAGKVVPNVPVANAKLHDDKFVIGVDDVLAINVWKEAEISRSVPVRSDGKISLPLAGEITAAGQTPKKLEDAIAQKLQNYISEPEVTVIVQEIRSQRFNILGLVARPGSYALGGPTTVLDAVALAGGFRDFAKQKSIYVLRQNQNGTQTRLAFNYKDVIKGKNSSQNVTLEPRDTVVVP